MAERISGKTELIGLIATPIRHSSSPKMHNEAFAKLGLDYAYLAFEVGTEQLEDTIKGFRAMNVRGSNVSMPNKTVVHKYLDKLSPAAELCGAVNTIVNDNGVLTGHITDGIGYMSALKDAGIDIIGKKMTIVGAGGAATAIQVQAALDGVAEISIFNRKDEFYSNAEQTVKKLREKTNCIVNLYDLDDLDKLKEEISTSVILTNATGVGMKPLEGKTYIPDKSFLREDLIVSDIVYAPRETELLKMAKEVDCKKTMNGLGMMLFQGAAAFEMWTGKQMPIEYMKEILVGILTGVFISFVCVVLICKVANADSQILYSILPKSITTPMGISLTNILGGIESITVVCIILTGILGYIMGEAILKISRIKHPISKGIALGTAAHAVGTSKALELGEVEGAMGSLSIGIAGCLTVILIPILSNFI